MTGLALGARRRRSRSSTASSAPTFPRRPTDTPTGESGWPTDSPGTAFESAAAARRGSDLTHAREPVRLDALSAAQVHRLAGAIDLLVAMSRVLREESEGFSGELRGVGMKMIQLCADIEELAELIGELGEEQP